MRWLTPRRQMTYAQWLEQCRQQAAARKAEADAANRAKIAIPKKPNPISRIQPQPRSPSDHGPPPKRRTPAARDPTWLPSVEYFQAGKPFQIGDISVSPFTIPHDAADPVGFVFQAEGVRMAVATDLGYIPPNVKAQLKGVDLLLLESNHDLEMLRDGPYPWSVKQRVLSRVGHLSNEAAATYLENEYDGQATYVILGASL